MLLKALPSSSIAPGRHEDRCHAAVGSPARPAPSSSPARLLPQLRRSFPARVPCIIRATIAPDHDVKSSSSLNGVIFEPFAEVQEQLIQVPPSSSSSSSCSSLSFARQRYSAPCEAALNEQINVEYNASYVYHTLYAYFDRDNVGLPGFAQFFKDSSVEEREHAEKLMKYQNMRGGRVKLQSILMPSMNEFEDPEKGDALCAMELTLALEKLVNEKLLKLHKVADEENDPQLTDFIEGEFLKPQVEDIKKVAGYVAQLRRVGKGHGVYHFDLQLQAV